MKEEIKINILGFVENAFILTVCALVVSKWMLAAYGLYTLIKEVTK